MDAVTRGTSEGLQLPLTIIAMLIVLVAMVVFVVFAQPVSGLRPFYKVFRDGAEVDPTGAKTLRTALGVDDLDAFQPGWETWVLTLRRE